MGLKDHLSADLKQAMRDQDELKRTVLRSILTALTVAEKRTGEAPDAEAELTIVEREAKRRREAAAQFSKGGRTDRAERELEELALIQTYLPQQLTPEEVEDLVRSSIDTLEAQGDPKRMGEVMTAIMPQVKGRADGRTVSQIVRRLLSGD